jgi:protein TonB
LRRAIIISLILHIVIVLVIFFLKPEQQEKRQQPLIAEIITPEQKPAPTMQTPKSKQRELSKKIPPTRSPKIRDKEPPKVMSEVPSQKSDRRKYGTSRKEEAGKPSPPTVGESQEATRKPVVIPPGYGVIRKKDDRATKDKLFDSETVVQTAKRHSDSNNDGSISLNTRDYRYFGYMQRLREKIEANWHYPAEAGIRRIAGEVYIRFVITKSGKLASVEILGTSGYRALDEAAVAALRDAAPYWPLPNEWGKDELTINGRFIYSLRDQRVR